MINLELTFQNLTFEYFNFVILMFSFFTFLKRLRKKKVINKNIKFINFKK